MFQSILSICICVDPSKERGLGLCRCSSSSYNMVRIVDRNLCIYITICLPVYLSFYLTICLSVWLFVFLSNYLSSCLTICLSVWLFKIRFICESHIGSMYLYYSRQPQWSANCIWNNQARALLKKISRRSTCNSRRGSCYTLCKFRPGVAGDIGRKRLCSRRYLRVPALKESPASTYRHTHNSLIHSTLDVVHC